MVSIDQIRNTLAALVAIVRAHDELRGRVRLQKLAYLLKKARFEPLAHVRFAYHHYGPYSDHLAGVLDDAVASGLVQEHETITGERRRQFTYRIDESHGDLPLLALTGDQQQKLSAFHQITRSTHWRTLELAATVVYLEQHAKLPREAAVARALKLKPACVEHRGEGMELLASLEL